MTSSLVSVIVPAFEAARFIERTLRGALNQTYADLEIIVVDDGSTDDTCAIVERVAGREPRLRLIRQPNGGVSHARNTGIAQARGAFIAPLDADDLWHPTKIEKQMRCFQHASARTGVVYCHLAWIAAHDQVIWPRRIDHAPTGQVYPHLAVGNVVGNASAPLFRRSLLDEVGGYDESFREGCEDIDLYLRLAECGDYALVPEFLVGYRRSRESMSMNIAKMERAVAQTTGKMLERHPQLPKRLLRWRNGNMYRYLALHALMNADYRRGLVLAGKSVASDPTLLLLWVLNRIGGKRRTAPEVAATRPHYYALDPVPSLEERVSPSRLDARRQAAAAQMRIAPVAVA